MRLLSLSPGAEPTHNHLRLLIILSQIQATAQRYGEDIYPTATLTVRGTLTIACPGPWEHHSEEQSLGPVGVKGQGPKWRGGVEPGADCGATDGLSITRPPASEQDFYRQMTALHSALNSTVSAKHWSPIFKWPQISSAAPAKEQQTTSPQARSPRPIETFICPKKQRRQ